MKIIHAKKENNFNIEFIKGHLYIPINTNLDSPQLGSMYLFSCGQLVSLSGITHLTTGSNRQLPASYIDVTDDYTLISTSLLTQKQLGL